MILPDAASERIDHPPVHARRRSPNRCRRTAPPSVPASRRPLIDVPHEQAGRPRRRARVAESGDGRAPSDVARGRHAPLCGSGKPSATPAAPAPRKDGQFPSAEAPGWCACREGEPEEHAGRRVRPDCGSHPGRILHERPLLPAWSGRGAGAGGCRLWRPLGRVASPAYASACQPERLAVRGAPPHSPRRVVARPVSTSPSGCTARSRSRSGRVALRDSAWRCWQSRQLGRPQFRGRTRLLQHEAAAEHLAHRAVVKSFGVGLVSAADCVHRPHVVSVAVLMWWRAGASASRPGCWRPGALLDVRVLLPSTRAARRTRTPSTRCSSC